MKASIAYCVLRIAYCVLRVGALHDSGLVARRLGVLPMCNCASPACLHEHGTPQTLQDLDRHRLVHCALTLGSVPAGCEYHDGERYRFRDMRSVITVNSTDAYQAACLAGLGIIQAPAPAPAPAPALGVRDLFAQGQLVEVLPAFAAEPMPVSLLYPNRRHLSKRAQTFMAWLAQVLAPQLDQVSA